MLEKLSRATRTTATRGRIKKLKRTLWGGNSRHSQDGPYWGMGKAGHGYLALDS